MMPEVRKMMQSVFPINLRYILDYTDPTTFKRTRSPSLEILIWLHERNVNFCHYFDGWDQVIEIPNELDALAFKLAWSHISENTYGIGLAISISNTL